MLKTTMASNKLILPLKHGWMVVNIHYM